MKANIQKIPIPLCGVMLGTAALGNLLQSYSESIRTFCGIAAGFLLLLCLLKLCMFPKMVIEDLKNPIMASVSATFPMTIMILSTYVKPYIGRAAYVIWLFAIALHLILIVYFTMHFLRNIQMPKVFASYFIVYVGITVAAITAPVYNSLSLGAIAFLFGFIALLVLFILISYRYLKYKDIPEAAKPLICIYASPASLCVAGYVQSVAPKSYGFLIGILIFSSICYLFALVKLIGCLRLPFYPSYAAFTFPFVISAIAAKQSMVCLASMGRPITWLSTIVVIKTVIAVVLVVYTYVRFMIYLVGKPK